MKPYTVLRLERLQYGESMVLYRGSQDLCADIRHNTDSPAYCAVLMAIREAAERLEAQGRIEIIDNAQDQPFAGPE